MLSYLAVLCLLPGAVWSQSEAVDTMVGSREYSDAVRLTVHALLNPNVAIALGRSSLSVYHERIPEGRRKDVDPISVAANLGLIRFAVLNVIKPSVATPVAHDEIFVKAPSAPSMRAPTKPLEYLYRPMILLDDELFLVFLRPFDKLFQDDSVRDSYSIAAKEIEEALAAQISPQELFLKLGVEAVFNEKTTFALFEDIGAIRIHGKVPQLKARYHGGPDAQRMFNGSKEKMKRTRELLKTIILPEGFQKDIQNLQLLVHQAEISSPDLPALPKRLNEVLIKLKNSNDSMTTQFGGDVTEELAKELLQKMEILDGQSHQEE